MEFILQHWEVIVATLSPIIAWFGGRKLMKTQQSKAESEAAGVELDTISSNFKVYQDLINDLEGRFKRRIEELEKDLERMKTLNVESRKVIRNQERYIQKLKVKLSSYEELED